MIVITNPANKNLFESIDGSEQIFGGVRVPSLNCIRIDFIPYIPERNIEYKWEPPVDKFIEYGPEDEDVLRPLGRGTVHEIDHGPLFYVMDDTPMPKINFNLWTP